MSKICQTCFREFNNSNKFFCSITCRNKSPKLRKEHSKFMKNRVPWNIGYGDYIRGDKNPRWVGDKITYAPLHQQLNDKIPKVKCSKCGINNHLNKGGKSYLEYANITGIYSRELSNWSVLCTKCHRNLDKGWLKRKRKNGKFA